MRERAPEVEHDVSHRNQAGPNDSHRNNLRQVGDVVRRTITLDTIAMHRLSVEVELLSELADARTAVPSCTNDTDSTVMLTRRFVSGTTLRDKLASGPAAVERVVEMAIAVLDTLARLHACGVVHGSIKPTNIVLAGDAWESPVLVDFGLSRHAAIAGSRDQISLDAVRYLAPEQTGLLERGVDGRADLYALGLCMYEAVARPVFAASTISELLREQLTVIPPPLSAVVAGVAAGFERIVARLVRMDPRDRYQTAAGVRADLEALRGGADVVVGAHDRRDSLTEPAFMGRAEELDALATLLEDAADGHGGIALLAGESGTGKTWLLEELRRRAIHHGAWVLLGQGSVQAPQQPFHVLSAVARDLVTSAPAGSSRAARVAERAGPVGPSIVEALPATAPLFGVTPASSQLDPNAEQRSVASLATLLDALGSHDEPALVLIDDAQWADVLTLRLLERWDGDGRNVLVVLAYRSDEVGDDHPLHRVRHRGRVELAGLSVDEIRRQTVSMAGELPPAVADLVAEHAVGNPFVASALLHGLVESKVLVHADGGWRFAEHALEDLQVPRSMADAVASRVARLPAPARRLLSVGAILGKHFDPGLAADLSSIAMRDAIEILRELRGRFVWVDRAACVFVHDRIREALLAEIDEDERRRLHVQAAERMPADRLFDLAYHYDAAGVPERAFTFALEAAERAAAQHDLELAERYYRTSARGITPATSGALVFRVMRGLGEVLLIRSKYEESARCFDEAARVAPDRARRADIEERRAQLALKQGNMPGAIEHGERALRLIGRFVPRSSFACFVIVLWEVFVQILHTHAPRAFVGRRPLDRAGEEMFAIGVWNTLNGPYFFARGVAWVLWAHLRALNLSERYPPSRALGREYGNHGSACAGFPSLFERAIRYTRRGAEICAELGDVWGQARAMQFHALNLCATGRYRAAIEAGELGGQLFDRAGDLWNAQFALNWAALARYRMGDLAGCAASAKQLYARGKMLDSALGFSFAFDAWVRAVEGRVPENLIKDVLARPFEHVQTWSILAQAEAIRLLAQDQPAEAEELLATWLDRMKVERAFFHESNISMVVYLGAAQRRRAELLARVDPAAAGRMLARARRTCRRAVKRTRRFRNCIPHALREAALTEASANNLVEARSLIEASIAAAAELDARFELALSREVRGELGPVIRGSAAAEELERVRAELAAMREPLLATPRVTVSLIDRFEAILDVGNQIARSLVVGDVYSNLQRGALGLLRAQHAAVIDARHAIVAGSARAFSSRVLADASVQGVRTVVWSDTSGGPDDALARAGVRSALCAPILVRNSVAALLYLTHSEVRDAFGEAERRVAAFLAALAGAAIENSEGFAQIQAFSRELEQRVEARTAELAAANAALAENLRRLQSTQEQLLHAGRMAAVGTLIAGLSHELNNPLSVILGNLEHLHALVPPDPRTTRMLDAISRNGKRAARLVDTLLRFSRTGSAGSDRVKAEELVHEVVVLVSAEARTRGVVLHVSISEGLPELVVSRHDIESALVNVTTNALQATPAGGRVELRAEPEPRDATPGICFSVRDNGSGIAPEILPQIFDPFFTTKPEGHGTGLGLSLAREAATVHGGWLDAESTLGAGTTMRLWLPSASRA